MKIRDNISKSRLAALFIISTAMLLLTPSCFNDDFNKAMKLELFPYEVMVPANNAPVPGNKGIITNGVVTGSSIQLLWALATDVETVDLEYILYYSESNTINTPEEAEKNGSVVAGWTINMMTATADSLSSGRTYYFNVVVRDSDGNRTAYNTVAVTTQSDSIYMYSVGPFPGALTVPTTASVRADIDSLCSAPGRTLKTYMPPCLNKRAFISISSADDIAGMPRRFGIPEDRKIIGPTGMQIGANWADLLDGDIAATLFAAGIAPDHWWSGSTWNGVYDSSIDNCNGWTSTSRKGQSGKSDKTDAGWLEGETPDCDATRYVLCVCW